MPATPDDEFALIAKLTAHLPADSDVVVGPGDDAAVIRWSGDRDLVVTTDAQVEGRHYLVGAGSPDELGARALAINLSDIAAMGALPRFALISLLLNPATQTEWIDRYYAGMRAAADAHGVAIVGGNISGSTGPFTADVTLIGQIEPGRAILRSGAREGDAILVTGTVGAAAAGLLAATNPQAVARVHDDTLARVREAWLRPVARVTAGRALASAGCASAMIDISDGLAADLGHILSASGVGAVLEAPELPIDAATREVARALGRDPVDLALYGGDDYELLFTVPAALVESTIALLVERGVAATRIGWIQHQRDGLLLREEGGAIRAIEARGWDHLRPQAPM
jgi:thiamine-monophosphate kinase